MKSFQFGYTQDWKNSPMAFWVHIETNKEPWYHSESFSPPAPIKHGDLGYPVLTIEFDGFNFIFTSKEQLEKFITIMGKKLLPTSTELSNKRPGTKGPNSHWLSRLPGGTKPWKYREKLVKYCKKIKFKD